MYRKYIKDLDKWLNNPYRKPLILWGARQVGKSYLLEELFAKAYFKNKYIYVDCKKDQDFVDYCEKHENVKDIINYLSLDRNKTIDENVLLIFDEVQECLPLVSSLKYFCQDYRQIPVIATGSMVRIKIQRESKQNKKGFLFPIGNINQLTIYPMNFEEYLINKNKKLYDVVVQSYKDKVALDDSIHNMVMNNFYEYLLIGGMPEVVDAYIKTDSLQQSREILKDLYDNYLSDMALYQASPESVVRARKVFENIYTQLNKESKNFSPSLIEHNAKNREMRSPIDWLSLSFLVNKSSLVKQQVTIPLIDSDESLFRLYLSDIGMFSYQSGINAKTFISDDGRNTLSGIFFENYVSCEIVNAGLKLFYWKGKNNAEFEFVVEKQGNIIPIDVKKSKGTLNSLAKFKDHNKFEYAVKISDNKYGFNEDNKILTIPFYLTFMFLNDLKQEL